MTVELWYGSKPANPGEQNALIELYDFLQPQPEHYVLMANFHAGRSHEIDLMVLKQQAFIVTELKHFWNKIAGSKEGDWTFTRPDGCKAPFRNPYKQVRGSSFGWQEWCRENQAELAKVFHCQDLPLRQLEPFEYVVIFPDLHADSEINVGDHPVQVVGLPKFRAALVIRSGNGPVLNASQMQAIPRMLGLTRWHIVAPHAEDGTVKLDRDDFQPPLIRMLVALGHEYCQSVFHLEKDVITVGRDGENDLPVRHESISRRHAEIRHQEGRWLVRDLGSLNGTWVSYGGDPRLERRIDRENALKNGSVVRFGQASFTLLLSE